MFLRLLSIGLCGVLTATVFAGTTLRAEERADQQIGVDSASFFVVAEWGGLVRNYLFQDEKDLPLDRLGTIYLVAGMAPPAGRLGDVLLERFQEDEVLQGLRGLTGIGRGIRDYLEEFWLLTGFSPESLEEIRAVRTMGAELCAVGKLKMPSQGGGSPWDKLGVSGQDSPGSGHLSGRGFLSFFKTGAQTFLRGGRPPSTGSQLMDKMLNQLPGGLGMFSTNCWGGGSIEDLFASPEEAERRKRKQCGDRYVGDQEERVLRDKLDEEESFRDRVAQQSGESAAEHYNSAVFDYTREAGQKYSLTLYSNGDYVLSKSAVLPSLTSEQRTGNIKDGTPQAKSASAVILRGMTEGSAPTSTKFKELAKAEQHPLVVRIREENWPELSGNASKQWQTLAEMAGEAEKQKTEKGNEQGAKPPPPAQEKGAGGSGGGKPGGSEYCPPDGGACGDAGAAVDTILSFSGERSKFAGGLTGQYPGMPDYSFHGTAQICQTSEDGKTYCSPPIHYTLDPGAGLVNPGEDAGGPRWDVGAKLAKNFLRKQIGATDPSPLDPEAGGGDFSGVSYDPCGKSITAQVHSQASAFGGESGGSPKKPPCGSSALYHPGTPERDCDRGAPDIRPLPDRPSLLPEVPLSPVPDPHQGG